MSNPAKPTALKILAGNPGKRKLNQNEPQMPVGAPDCPDWLTEDAKIKWREIAPLLGESGVLRKTDGSALAGYCQSWARWKQAEAVVEVSGITTPTPQGIKKHPAVTVATEAKKEMRAFAALLGLDPSSRSKLAVKPNEKDPLDEFLSRKKA